MANNNGLVIGLLVLGLILTVMTSFMVYNMDDVKVNENTKLSDSDKLELVNAIVSQLPNQTQVAPSIPSDEKLDILINKYSDDEEAKALELVNAELGTKDFKKVLVDVLNANGTDIETYKDIESIVVKDSDVDVSGKSADVELKIKVSYFENGDSDEEDLQKALLTVVLEVSDLDDKEGFVDAEVESYSNSDFTLVKFYD